MRWLAGVLYTLSLILLPIGGAGAAPAPAIRAAQKALDDLELQLQRGPLDDTVLLLLRARALEARESLGPLQGEAEQEAAVLQRDLEALGPAPGKDQAAEPPGLRARRKELQDSLTLAQAASKETQLIERGFERLLEAIKRQRREHFAEALLTQAPTPFSADLWRRAGPEWVETLKASGFRLLPSTLRSVLLSLGLLLLAAGLLARVPQALTPFLSRALTVTQRPTAVQFRLLQVLLGRLLPIALVLAFGALLLDSGADPEAGQALLGLLGALAIALGFAVFFGGLLRGTYEGQALFGGSLDGALRQARVLEGLAALLFLIRLSEWLVLIEDGSLEVVITGQVILGLLVGGFLLFSARVFRAARPGVAGLWWLVLALGLVLVTVLSLGYVALGHLLAVRGLQSLAVLTGGRLLIECVRRGFAAPPIPQGLSREQRESLETAESRRFWIQVALEGALWVTSAALLLFLWSLDRKDLLLWLSDRFATIQIGKLTLSPSGLLSGFGVFLMLLAVTRWLQSTLDQKVLQRSRLDAGLRHSIRSGLGYLGFALAAMVGISVMGFDLSNLALIAGALSVGIGFGLQNIVNNFISGLILLIERPIKAGDWVVVGEHQGVVRKISVRATELMTFDRTTVFIPNSSLIAGAVQNKTHPDRVGRIILPLTLDPEEALPAVEELLLSLVSERSEIRKKPAPAVFVTGFDEETIHLELVVFIHEVDHLKAVTSDLYRAILAAFARKGIRPKSTRRPPIEVQLVSPERTTRAGD